MDGQQYYWAETKEHGDIWHFGPMKMTSLYGSRSYRSLYDLEWSTFNQNNKEFNLS